MNLELALKKLNTLLPLEKRQKELSLEYRQAHKNILHTLATEGAAPKSIQKNILNTLEGNDLVVLDDNGDIIGAYPFSLRKTEHHVFNNNIDLYAMCAFDAIAIAPVFNVITNISSACHITKDKIEIVQNAGEIVSAKPTHNIFIGIRWQSAGECAAVSLCMEMVFLKDEAIALEWKNGDDNFSVFSLKDAIDFSIRYFKPLLES